MANVNSVSNSYSTSSTASLYGSRNVLTGLASGLDTETMIQNSVSGYQTKITQLQQQQEKIEWKQDAYRSIIDKANSFSSTYASYTSKTNLMSNSFFSKYTTVTSGANASKVSATGKTGNDIEITSIRKLATAARYTVSADALGLTNAGAGNTAVDWAGEIKTSNIAGSSLTVDVDGKSVTVSFGADDKFESVSEFVSALSEKLTKAAGEEGAGVTARLDGTNITFDGNVKISGGTGAFADMVTSAGEGEDAETVFSIPNDFQFTKTESMSEYLNGKTVNVTLNGATKQLTLGTYGDSNAMVTDLNRQLAEKFGTYEVTNEDGTKTTLNKVTARLDDGGALTFQGQENSIIQVNSAVNEQLGLGNGYTSYLNTGATLGSLGVATGDGSLTINGVNVGSFGADDTLQSVLDAINRSGAGVTVSYSTLTNEFAFTAKETGAAGRIDFGGELASLFTGEGGGAGTFVRGEDAEFTAKINGTEMTLTRASNTVDMDGLNVTLKDTFAAGTGSVSFKTSTDADSIISAVKSFVADYNALVTEIHNAYKTQPLTKTATSSSSSTTYEPLTEKDKEGMSESAIASYEEKAKTGLLFGDGDLSAMYTRLTNAFSPSELAAAGITASYDRDSGVTTLSVDEDALRNQLEKDPDKVKEVFAGTSTREGLVSKLKSTVDTYASTSYAGTGILVNKAGSKKNASSLLSNELQKKSDQISEQITKWQTKLSDQIDYYTRQFTLLEQLMNTMNSQSSMLSGLMGG